MIAKIFDCLGYYIYYLWVQIDIFARNNNDIITLWLTVIATYIGLSTWFKSRGHDLKVVYAISSHLGTEKRISPLFIYNNKNKPEAITQIDVLFGGNVSLELMKFHDPLIIPSYSMVKVKLEPVSLYAIDDKITNMDDIFENRKIKPIFYFTTPEKIIKARTLKMLPYDNFMKVSLTKKAFFSVYSMSYKLEDTVYSYKIRYVGKIILESKENCSFHIYRDGIFKMIYGPNITLWIDKESLSNKDKIKNIILDEMKKRKLKLKIIELEEFKIDKFYNDFEAKSIPIIRKGIYFFIEKYIKFILWLESITSKHG